MDLKNLRKSLEKQNYIFDEELLLTVYIAIKLGKPLLVEGAAGVGKTEVAKVLASAFGVELIRLQCYSGLDESKALYEWNYQKQLLSIQLGTGSRMVENRYNDEAGRSNNSKGRVSDGDSVYNDGTDELGSLFTREFLLERPLLKSINSETRSVLLIDEVDKTDEEFEAFLLEMLSDFQISIPEIGTIKAKSKPYVILTSNNARQLSDALKRRCVYLFIDYPSREKEFKIINARLKGVPEKLAEEAAEAVAVLRKNDRIRKKPSIAETLDWVAALMAIDKKHLDKDGIEKTFGFLLKNRNDQLELWKDDKFNAIFSEKHY